MVDHIRSLSSSIAYFFSAYSRARVAFIGMLPIHRVQGIAHSVQRCARRGDGGCFRPCSRQLTGKFAGTIVGVNLKTTEGDGSAIVEFADEVRYATFT